MNNSEKQSILKLIESWRKLSCSSMIHAQEAIGYARCANELEDLLEYELGLFWSEDE